MIGVQDLRAGTVYEDPTTGSGPWVVLKYEHVKMGRGTATIRIKAKNLKTGTIMEKSFINSARVQEVNLEKRQGQYLYRDATGYVFMDPSSYEQFTVPTDLVGDYGKFLKEGTQVDLKFYSGEAISVMLPLKMKFRVTETEPGYKGNTVTNIYKDAVIDTGSKIKVPMFINIGEEILVNTESGEYVERVR